MWANENIEDVKSDMSAFHRVDDISRIPGSSFFPRVERLVFYAGAVQGSAKIKHAQETQRTAGASASRGAARSNVPASVMLAEHERDGWAERA